MLVATWKDVTNPAELGIAAKHERTTFLDVIQGLVRQPSAGGVVLVDGTKVISSTYSHPPIKAPIQATGWNSRGSGGRRQPNKFVSLRRLVQHARQKTEQERQQHREQQQPQLPLGGVKSSGSPASPVPPPQALKPLPEINYYIGTLELALGFDPVAVPLGSEDTTATVRAVPDHGHSPSVTGTTKTGYQSGGEGAGGRTTVATIMSAPWPPEYILDTVVQPLFTPEEEGERTTPPMTAMFVNRGRDASQRERKQQGIVIVSSVNCGFLDMASNFLQSVKLAVGEVKVRRPA